MGATGTLGVPNLGHRSSMEPTGSSVVARRSAIARLTTWIHVFLPNTLEPAVRKIVDFGRPFLLRPAYISVQCPFCCNCYNLCGTLDTRSGHAERDRNSRMKLRCYIYFSDWPGSLRTVGHFAVMACEIWLCLDFLSLAPFHVL